MKSVEYYFATMSPWAYLGHQRLLDLCHTHGATLRVMPIDLGGKVFPASGGTPLAQRPEQRKSYRLIELKRWSEHLGIPMNIEPKHFPVPGLPSSLLVIATDMLYGSAAAGAMAGAILRAVWAEERNIADPATLESIAAASLSKSQLKAPTAAELLRLFTQAESEEAGSRFEAYTDAALAAQVFGSPWYIVDGEPFWGQDRLDFVARALAR